MPSRRPAFAVATRCVPRVAARVCGALRVRSHSHLAHCLSSMAAAGSVICPLHHPSSSIAPSLLNPRSQFSPVTLRSISPQNQKPRFGSHKKVPTSPVAGPCLVALVVCRTRREEDLLFEAIAAKLSGTPSFRRRSAEHCRVSLFSWFDVELLSWISVKDISKDGGILKNIITEGEKWDNPKDLDEVFVKYEARLEDGTLFQNLMGWSSLWKSVISVLLWLRERKFS